MTHPLNRVVAGLAFVAALSVSAAGFQEGPVYQVGDPGVTSPRVIKEVRPQYSPEAMRAKSPGRGRCSGPSSARRARPRTFEW